MRLAHVLLLVALAACQSVSGLSELSLKREKVDAGKDGGERDAGEDSGPAGTGGAAGAAGTGMPMAGVPAAGMPFVIAGTGGSGGVPVPPPCTPDGDVECEILRECGCRSGQHCQKRGADAKPTCVPRGVRKLGESCKSPDDCAEGTCDHHTCRAYCDRSCDAGKCLPAVDANDKPMAGINVCWMSCQAERKDSCFDGTTCQTLTVGDTKGAFCQAPANPCPTMWNGVCDEPNSCAPGTDTVDCSCKRTKEGSACDLVNACGCKEGLSCQPSDTDSRTPACLPYGKVEAGGFCDSKMPCGPGLGCYGSLCKKFCTTAGDCQAPGDTCASTYTWSADDKPVENPDVKTCLIACELSTGKPCKPDAACSDWGNGEAYCTACKRELAGAECGLVENCGCDGKAGTGCTLTADDTGKPAAVCLPAGNLPKSTACGRDSDCVAGTMCIDNVCHAYCTSEKDCKKGTCLLVSVDDQSTDIGACFEDCTMAGVTCGANTKCDKIPLSTGDVPACVVVPLTTTCPTANKRCDEPAPKGTGLCAMGADAAECK